MRLGWVGPECQRNKPLSPGPQRQPTPTQAHLPLPMSAGSCLGQGTLPGTLGERSGAPERGMSRQMDLQRHMPDPEAGLVVRAFSQLSLFLGCSHPSLLCPSHSNCARHYGRHLHFSKAPGRRFYHLPTVPMINPKHRSTAAQAHKAQWGRWVCPTLLSGPPYP